MGLVALEIERKFASGAPPWLRDHAATEIEQGYVAIDDLRLRNLAGARAGRRSAGAVESSILGLWRYADASRGARACAWATEVAGDARFANRAFGAGREREPAALEPARGGRAHSVAPTRTGRGASSGSRAGHPPQRQRGTGAGPAANCAGAGPELDRRAAGARLRRLHEARKELKKLRAALRLARDGLDRGFYRAESKRFREAGRELATARDAQVKLETLASLRGRFSDELSDEALDRLSGRPRAGARADPGGACRRRGRDSACTRSRWGGITLPAGDCEGAAGRL